ncbi:MAG: hypothetical protein ABH871_03910 [Pseudomonadota bacterium]
MSYVNISEVGTFQIALGPTALEHSIDILKVVSTTAQRCNAPLTYVPTQTVGQLWNLTSHHMPVAYAFRVADAHTDTPVVYGIWGKAMDAAPSVLERMLIGAKLLYVHAGDPKWELDHRREDVHFRRMWRYDNTTHRAEAFAAISEFKEWLIVMQRGVFECIRPHSIVLSSDLHRALATEEQQRVEGMFGCDLTIGDKSTLMFPGKVLGYRSEIGNRGRFARFQKRLEARAMPTTFAEASADHRLIAEIIKSLRSGKPYDKIAQTLGMQPKELVSLFRSQVGLEPWSFMLDDVSLSAWLNAIDERHRAALHASARDAAKYIASMSARNHKLRGVDLGGGSLEVTEIFLRELRKLTGLNVELDVIDPVLSNVSSSIHMRQNRIQQELGIAVNLKPYEWLDFVKHKRPHQEYDFAVSFQLLSLLPDNVMRETFKTLHQSLRHRGRLFAAFEPFDRTTLKRYDGQTYYQRTIDWYHDQARQAGFDVKLASAHLAHEEDNSSIMANLKLMGT